MNPAYVRRSHLPGPDGRVLCGADNRRDDNLGPKDGPACLRCAGIQANGGKRPPPVYKRHYYHYVRRGDIIAGGVYCAMGRSANPDLDVPINLRGMRPEGDDMCRKCLRKGGIPAAGYYSAVGAPEQVELARERRRQEEAGWANLRKVFDSYQVGGPMSLAEAEIRFRTARAAIHRLQEEE